MAKIDRGNVQGLVFQSYNYPLARHFLFQFGDRAGARAFLRNWTEWITHGAVDLASHPDPLVNIGLTWPGLVRTGAVDPKEGAYPAEKAFPEAYRNAPDAKAMGDYGDSAPRHWWNGRFRSEDVHVLFLLYCRTAESLASHSEAVRSSAGQFGLQELIPTRDGAEALTGCLARDGILHFGYRDGISQPQVNWDDDPAATDRVDLRHFLLGYGTEQIESIPRHAPWDALTRDGSYLVLRWLYQDVAKFNRFLRERSATLWPQMPAADAQELLAAKMMGRWRNGTPLVLSPEKHRQELAWSNDFTYAADPDGARCPFSAHIRIVNRRDDELTFPNASMFPPGTPRVIRRGNTYGSHLDGEVDDGKDRGIIGMFLCTNINQQFFVLTRWINKTDFLERVENHHGQDPLFANRQMPNRSDSFEFEAHGEKLVLTGLQDLIRTQGVLTLFLPSIASFRELSAADPLTGSDSGAANEERRVEHDEHSRDARKPS